MSLGTYLYTKIFGNLVGTDSLGNAYYESNQKRWFGKKNRWTIYCKKNNSIANIDSSWFQWCHYLSDIPPMKLAKQYHWMIEGGTTEYDKINQKYSKIVYNGHYETWNYKNKS